jgi:predicted nucleic acid-binding protein
VISEIRRGRDPQVTAWAQNVRESDLYLSVLTLGEIRKGIERLRGRDPAQAQLFEHWLGQLGARFADRILPIDDRAAERWGALNAERTRSTIDSLIAATAYVYGLTIATRNMGDFEGCGVQLLDPWQPDHRAI